MLPCTPCGENGRCHLRSEGVGALRWTLDIQISPCLAARGHHKIRKDHGMCSRNSGIIEVVIMVSDRMQIWKNLLLSAPQKNNPQWTNNATNNVKQQDYLFLSKFSIWLLFWSSVILSLISPRHLRSYLISVTIGSSFISSRLASPFSSMISSLSFLFYISCFLVSRLLLTSPTDQVRCVVVHFLMCGSVRTSTCAEHVRRHDSQETKLTSTSTVHMRGSGSHGCLRCVFDRTTNVWKDFIRSTTQGNPTVNLRENTAHTTKEVA